MASMTGASLTGSTVITKISSTVNCPSLAIIDISPDPKRLGTKEINKESASISANGLIAGIQLHVIATELEVNNNLIMNIESRSIEDQHTILIFGLNGETLSGEIIQLFTASDDYEITSIIVANVTSDSMEIEQFNMLLPDIFELSQNYPNPFNPNTQIQFSLGKNEIISMQIYNIQGRVVQSLINNSYTLAGYHQITWDGTNSMGIQVPSGMYFYKLESEHQTLTKKMVLMK